MDHEGPPNKIIQIDEALVKRELGKVVRETVEETLNRLLDAEADELCKAGRNERSPDRVDTRAGSYQRNLQAEAGTVKLKVPKIRTIPFESAIIEGYKRRECSVEEALIEMCLAGVSVRRVGHAGFGRAGLETEQADLREDRAVEDLQAGGALPLGVPRRDRAEAHVG